MTKTSECRLCLQRKELRESHVLPEFLFTQAYDNKHRFYGLSSIEGRGIRLFQKGLRERLLCGDCEGRLSVFEQHARGVLYGGAPISVQDLRDYIVVGNIDYRKLKLFLMSLLWRLDVSSLPRFKGTPLDPCHRERLRKMLVEENPGATWEYGCMITRLVHEGKPLAGLITPVFSCKVLGHWAYAIAAGGFVFTFVVSDHEATVAEPAFLQLDGTLRVPCKEFTQIPFLMRHAMAIMKTNMGKELPGGKA